MITASTIKINSDGSLSMQSGHLVLTTSETVIEDGRYAIHNHADDQHLMVAVQSVTGGHRLQPLGGLDLNQELNAPTSTNTRLRLIARVKRTLELLAPFQVSTADIAIVSNGDNTALQIKKVTRI